MYLTQVDIYVKPLGILLLLKARIIEQNQSIGELIHTSSACHLDALDGAPDHVCHLPPLASAAYTASLALPYPPRLSFKPHII